MEGFTENSSDEIIPFPAYDQGISSIQSDAGAGSGAESDAKDHPVGEIDNNQSNQTPSQSRTRIFSTEGTPDSVRKLDASTKPHSPPIITSGSIVDPTGSEHINSQISGKGAQHFQSSSNTGGAIIKDTNKNTGLTPNMKTSLDVSNKLKSGSLSPRSNPSIQLGSQIQSESLLQPQSPSNNNRNRSRTHSRPLPYVNATQPQSEINHQYALNTNTIPVWVLQNADIKPKGPRLVDIRKLSSISSESKSSKREGVANDADIHSGIASTLASPSAAKVRTPYFDGGATLPTYSAGTDIPITAGTTTGTPLAFDDPLTTPVSLSGRWNALMKYTRVSDHYSNTHIADIDEVREQTNLGDDWENNEGKTMGKSHFLLSLLTYLFSRRKDTRRHEELLRNVENERLQSLSPAKYLLSEPQRMIWKQKLNFILLNNPYVPLTLRAIIFILSIIALSLACSVYRYSGSFVPSINQQPSTIMAVVVQTTALVYLVYITYDEYSGKPIGLRSPKDKMKLIMLDLLFIIFSSANLSLAFNTLYDENWVCEPIEIPENLSKVPYNHVICTRQRGLAAFLFMILSMWVVTFTVSIFRLVERVMSP